MIQWRRGIGLQYILIKSPSWGLIRANLITLLILRIEQKNNQFKLTASLTAKDSGIAHNFTFLSQAGLNLMDALKSKPPKNHQYSAKLRNVT